MKTVDEIMQLVEDYFDARTCTDRKWVRPIVYVVMPNWRQP